MKYHILLAVEVEADPADFATAARNGFDAIADLFNEDGPIVIHLMPQDGSPEGVLTQQILDACFTAASAVEM